MVERLYQENIGKLPSSSDAKISSKDELPSGLSRQLIPKHVAVIMDGNRRWAKKKGMPSMYGHRAGIQALIDLVPIWGNWGIKVLTVFAFSSENWIRPQVCYFCFTRYLGLSLWISFSNSVRLSVIGDSTKLPNSLQRGIIKTTETTKNNSRFHLIMAVDYSGRNDIVQACQSISHKVKDGLFKPEDIDEPLLNQELRTNCTDGELRMSNFLMWQLAYTELYFDESLWPDFGEKEFAMALHSFQKRQTIWRRYQRGFRRRLVVLVVMILEKRFHKSSSLTAEEKDKVVPDKQFEADTGQVAASVAKAMSEGKLPAGLRHELLPKHVAVIVDGNRRWAIKKGMPSILGHGAGMQSLLQLADLCCNWGIEVLTVFLFSTENWIRPRDEVDFLMEVYQKGIFEEGLELFIRKGIQVSLIGDPSKLPISLQEWITKTTEATKNNSRLHFILAINYSGRGHLQDIDETIFNGELKTNCTEFPYPDLLIRTSGEQRISNFLMWQLAYTELYFEECMWPDFGEKEFHILLGALVVVLVVLIAEVFRKSSISFLCKSSTHSATKQVQKGIGKSLDEDGLPAGLIRELVPKHVAIIMDGNRRWAKNKGLPSMAGHSAGARSLMKLVPLCCKWGIKVLTVYAFSSENWVRPQMEVDFLMKLMERTLREELENFMRHGVRVSVIGDSRKLPESVQKWVTKVTETTKNNPRVHVILAINYGGRNDIVQACQSISHKVKDGLIKPEDVDETVICQELQTKCTDFPYPDLLIRTSGELRISNFLIWQLAYTEFYFDESLWPDFGEKEFAKALHSFQRRQRRFGGQDAKNK
ncbi:hypothetical protein MKW92_027628 [Papaver armeniacum]|nr:hypothetical protein MKW92_027628 [Papaver armeniacum]